MKLEFSRQIYENTQISKIRQMEAELFHANRQPNVTKLTVTLRNFTNASKNRTHITMGQLGR